MRTKYIIPLLLIFVQVQFAMAQAVNSRSERLLIQGRMIDGTPAIKIIPGDQGVWFYGMKRGYKISISEYKNDMYTPYRVIEENLLPATEEKFLSANLPEKYAEPMRKLIYEETYAPASQSFNDLAGASEAMNRKHFGFLLLSSYDPDISAMSGLQMTLPDDVSDLFKIKVEINGTEIGYEQSMLLRTFYDKLYSPQLQIKPDDRVMTLKWNHVDYEKQFVAYLVERSADGKNFKASGGPKIFNSNSPSGKEGFISVKDTVPDNYVNYWYRLAAYDAFGILTTGPAVKVMGRDHTAPPMPENIGVREGKKPGEVHVSWSAEPVADLAGFQVIASESEMGEYQPLHSKLLPREAREFSFRFETRPLLFYRVLSVDTAFNAAASNLGYLVLYDSIPPALPATLTAETDTNYVVTVKWSKSISADVKGYRLYKSFGKTHDFVPVTAQIITDTTFIDSLPKDRLEKKVYYQVVALDGHFNHSEPSEMVYAPIPDKIPPTTPLLMTAVRDKKGRVELGWNKSSSDDVKNQHVIRRMALDTVFHSIAVLSPYDSVYTDSDINNSETEYAEYYIVAVDSSGNKSERSNGKRILYKSDKQNSEISLESAAKEGEGIRLVWNYPTENYRVLIYRAENDGEFQLIGKAEDNNTFTDNTVIKGEKYRYKVSAIEKSGYRSPVSDELQVTTE